MFGYVTFNAKTLDKDRQARFRAFYCGLCHELRQRHGLVSSSTLSYDMTFLALLLNALYEPGEEKGRECCIPHPVKAHDFVTFAGMAYVADMNLALAYHKCQDNWLDDHNALSLGEAKLLEQRYERVVKAWPDQCAAIEEWLESVHSVEAMGDNASVDMPVNATGDMLGRLFQWKPDDPWNDMLRQMGNGLGRFIYFMDAYEDLPGDLRRKRFNPLKALSRDEKYELVCRDAMMMMMADATQAFEQLPILLDADILRNILYSGIWNRYGAIQARKKRDSEGETDAGSL